MKTDMKRAMMTVLCALIAYGCGDSSGPSLEHLRGGMEGDVYVNAEFGLRLRLPPDWHVATREQQDILLNMGTAVIGESDTALRAALEAQKHHLVALVMVFKHELGAPVAMNANFNIIAEYVGATPGIKTMEDYFFHTRRLLAATEMNYVFSDEVETIEVSGVPVTILDSHASFAGQAFQQRMLACRRGDYILATTLTFDTEEDRDAMMQVLTAMTFD